MSDTERLEASAAQIVPTDDVDRTTYVYGRGDYGTEYAGDLIRIIEAGNCGKARCIHAGSDKDVAEFGPGGNCRSLASLFAGIPIPEFDPRDDGIHCDRFEAAVLGVPASPKETGDA